MQKGLQLRSWNSFILTLSIVGGVAGMAAQQGQEEYLISRADVGIPGGDLIVSLRTEPKTFNPIYAMDAPSRTVISLMMSDLVHINRETQQTEPSLASSWEVTPDGRRYTLHLRRGVAFSDGHPMDADDVTFTFQLHLDEAVHSQWRDLLTIGGEPLAVKKLDSHTLVFELAQSYGAGERIFDSISILPRHVLEKPYQEGKLSEVWNLASAAQEIVGLGPFRLKEFVPGERLIVEKNPHYWKTDRKGRRLPYLNRILFQIAGSEQTDVIRFRAGQIHLLDRVSPQDFVLLKADVEDGQRMLDLGPGLDYNFLFFNLNDLGGKNLTGLERKQGWFRKLAFRRAVSAAIDRESIIKLVYNGLAAPLATHVTPGNKLWVNDRIQPDTYSTTRARDLLRQAGFSWNDDRTLVDATGTEVSFSILTTAGNNQRAKMATIIQEDLGKLGMKAQVVTMDFRSAIDRIFTSYNYEACLLGLRSGDVDPTAETNVWLSSGSAHLWHLGQSEPATEWEAEIDRLMKTQMISTDQAERKRLYDRVQQIIAEQLPIIPLASPNILVGVDRGVGNFRPGILAHYTLWNADELFFGKE